MPTDGRLLLDGEGGAQWLDLGAALLERFAAFRGRARQTQAIATASATAAPVEELAFLAFTLADQHYALPLEAVAEVMSLPPSLATLPHTDQVLLGHL
jgi:purine-binding chemotaxis protein CheW